jgi:1,2-diacylglycerol 3-beta-glucosyltransferase
MIIISILHIGIFLIFGIPLCYLAFLSLAAITVKMRPHAQAVRQRRFVIVVPAHDEESAIGKTVRSLKSIDYPRDLFEVVVVADNCTDQTAGVAQREGALVLVRTNPVERGKGYALRWGFDILLQHPAEFEAIAVIDADTTVSSNYLKVLNVAIETGGQVMQTSDLVEPCPEAWTTEAIRLSFMLYNYVRPLGRKALGFSAGLRGNGMCFTVKALRDVPWHAYSKAEDLEYGIQMLIAGYRVRFVPEAIALATMPQKAVNAESQRARWEGGRIGVIRRYAGPLLKTAITRRSVASLDALIDLVTPAFVNMMAVSLFFTLLTVVLPMDGTPMVGWIGWAWKIAVLCGMVHVLAGLIAAKDKSLVLTLVAIPRYVTWKILLYIKLAGKKRSQEWIRTTREPDMTSTTIKTGSLHQKD